MAQTIAEEKGKVSQTSEKYDHSVKTLVKYARDNNDASVVNKSYMLDSSDPIGYNPLLNSCNEIAFTAQFFQRYTTGDSYRAFEKSSIHGGAKDREKYRRYNNSADCLHVRKKNIG